MFLGHLPHFHYISQEDSENSEYSENDTASETDGDNESSSSHRPLGKKQSNSKKRKRHSNITDSEENDKPYACARCNECFTKLHYLKQHLSAECGQGLIATESPSKQLRSAGDSFYGAATIKPYTCRFCRRSFVGLQSLMNHIQMVHNGEKPFKCDLCDVMFTLRCNMLRHKRKIHKT